MYGEPALLHVVLLVITPETSVALAKVGIRKIRKGSECHKHCGFAFIRLDQKNYPDVVAALNTRTKYSVKYYNCGPEHPHGAFGPEATTLFYDTHIRIKPD